MFLAGIILLISITVPHSAFRLDLMASFLPQSFVEGSHLVTAVIGVLLLVIARGLARGWRRPGMRPWCCWRLAPFSAC